MPAVSKAQQQYMAIAEHEPSKLRGPKPKMTHQQLHDFAATKSKKLPEHVRKSKKKAPASGPGNRYDTIRQSAR